MYCSTKKHDGRKVHEQVGKSSQYSMECCKTHSFCNNATEWPELPPIPSIGKKEGMLFHSLKKEFNHKSYSTFYIVVYFRRIRKTCITGSNYEENDDGKTKG